MSARLPALAAIVAFAPILTGCSGSTVDTACDVAGVTEDVEHMLGESHLVLESMDALQCADDWAVAQVTTGGGGSGPTASTFVFEHSEVGWVLKSPEVVCGTDAGASVIPAELAALACGDVGGPMP